MEQVNESRLLLVGHAASAAGERAAALAKGEASGLEDALGMLHAPRRAALSADPGPPPEVRR